MADFTLSIEEYEALVSLARKGAVEEGKLIELEQFLVDVEKSNGITRDFVWVQWQELSAALPPGTKFPEKWPPELRRSIELVSRKIARVDVDAVVDQYATEPVEVLVTRDPAAIVGWTPIDDFFVT